MKKGPSIRYLVLLANAFVLLLPVFAVWFLRLWDGHLVRVTEQQLIAEGTLIAEAFRQHVRELRAQPMPSTPAQLAAIEPRLPLTYVVEPAAAAPAHFASERSGVAWSAGAKVQPFISSAEQINLSAVRILDPHGCVVATTEADLGGCLDEWHEVREALQGRYAASARAPFEQGAPRALGRIGRSSNMRVFAALPVLDEGNVLGVVLLSRTSSSPLEVVWTLRYTVLAALVLCLAVTAAISMFLSRRIAQPVRAITDSATAMAHGEPARSLAPTGFVPAEVATLSAALDRLTTQLTDRAAYNADFAANVSHEMKTPIAAIRGAIELLQESWETMPVAQRQRFLANIDDDAARMERLVSRLLQLARIQSAPEAVEEIPVRRFFAELLSRYDGQVTLHIATETPPTIAIHPDHLEAAVHNLIDNAIRHSGGKPVEVDLGVSHGRLAVSVRDHGRGISAGNQARLFDRFFTTERDRGGTGLGLAIVRAVAETRGGRVDLETGDAGSVFKLIL